MKRVIARAAVFAAFSSSMFSAQQSANHAGASLRLSVVLAPVTMNTIPAQDLASGNPDFALGARTPLFDARHVTTDMAASSGVRGAVLETTVVVLR